MNKLHLMKSPELFQGEKYLNTNKNYFEGWYFKNISNKKGISFIPGISIDNQNKIAFIQIITDDLSYFIKYDINDFKFNINPFYIKIDKNYFSKEGINIDIKDTSQNLIIYGNLKYSNCRNISTNLFCPNIMGPFSYIPFMECNHAILNMKNEICGSLNINGNDIRFDKGVGYIEKDWGYSFPKSYIWCQCNNFKNSNASFMCSIADIDFKILTFRGIICDLIIGNEEFKFTTYNNVKLYKYNIDNNLLNITLKKGSYYLNIKSNYNSGHRLSAPVEGRMEKDIFESISEEVIVTLKRKDKIIFLDTSINCGLEIVK